MINLSLLRKQDQRWLFDTAKSSYLILLQTTQNLTQYDLSVTYFLN